MNRRLPSLASLCLAALLSAALGLAWLTAWVFSWQGLNAEVLGGPGGPTLYSALWHGCQFSSQEPAPLAAARPRHLRLTGFFHPPRAGKWQAALVSQGPAAISLAGEEWQVPPLAIEPVPNWSITASKGQGAAMALDRDPATRFTSGAPQKGGESLTLDLGRPRPVLGLVLDAASSANDSPAALKVELSPEGESFHQVAKVGGAAPGLAMAEAFFPSMEAQRLRLTQTGKRPGFYWSVHELYLVDEEMLERRARSLELSAQPQALTLTLDADPRHPAASRGYLLARVFLRPPGGSWQALPAHRLSPTREAGAPALAWLALALDPWTARAALACLALLLVSLYRDWLWPEE